MFLGFSKWTSLGRSHVLLWIYHKIFLLIDWLLITCDLQSWNFRNILNDVFYLHLWPQLSPSGPWPVVVVTNLFDFLPCVASQNTRFQAMETQWLLSLFWITCRCSFLSFTENRILLRASSYCYVDNECNVGCLWQLLECRMCFSEPNKKPFSLVCQPSTWRLQLGDSTSVCLCLYAIRVRRCVLMVIFFGRKYTSYPYKKIKFCQVRLCKRQCSYISENKLSPSVWFDFLCRLFFYNGK